MNQSYSAIQKLLCVTALLLSTSSAVQAHSGTPNNAAWEACDGKPKSAYCQYTGFHDDIYKGTCQQMSESMLCVRNQPIEKPKGQAEKHPEHHPEHHAKGDQKKGEQKAQPEQKQENVPAENQGTQEEYIPEFSLSHFLAKFFRGL